MKILKHDAGKESDLVVPVLEEMDRLASDWSITKVSRWKGTCPRQILHSTYTGGCCR